MKQLLHSLWSIEAQIRFHIRVSRFLFFHVPLLGKVLSLLLDRVLLIVYGIDLLSSAIAVRALSISHPTGILIGGNGVVSSGRVALMSGVKCVGKNPDDPEYQRRHRERRVFVFGDNVVVGANTVLLGPLDICDNVVIGAMSLVNQSISEPGVYAGVPAQKVSERCSDAWVAHLRDRPGVSNVGPA